MKPPERLDLPIRGGAGFSLSIRAQLGRLVLSSSPPGRLLRRLPESRPPTSARPPPCRRITRKLRPPAGRKRSPTTAYSRGKWWEIFNDPALNALEEQVNISNQNVLQAEAQFREARAGVPYRALRPLSPRSPVRPPSPVQQASARLASRFGRHQPARHLRPPGERLLHRATSGAASAAASPPAPIPPKPPRPLLENARLLYQSELAQDYFQLHGLDGDIGLLQATVKSYQEFLSSRATATPAASPPTPTSRRPRPSSTPRRRN